MRGIEGKVQAVRYARENKKPFLGICLGMQAAVIEYTRTFLDRPIANSAEFEPKNEGEGKNNYLFSLFYVFFNYSLSCSYHF